MFTKATSSRMAESLTKTGIHFDELNKIRILEPEVSSQANELKDECKDFVERITEFHSLAQTFINLIGTLASEVEQAKMRAIGFRNQLKSVAKQREAQQQQLQGLILEKSTELERLRIQHQSFLRTEQEQQEFIQQMMLNC